MHIRLGLTRIEMGGKPFWIETVICVEMKQKVRSHWFI